MRTEWTAPSLSSAVRPPSTGSSHPSRKLGLTRYIQTLRERAWIVIAAVGDHHRYRARLRCGRRTRSTRPRQTLLVTPISTSDTSLVGLLGLFLSSSDPTRDVETASVLITNTEAATRGLAGTGFLLSTHRELLGKVEAGPLASSSIVAVTARERQGALARDLSHNFATQAVENQAGKPHGRLNRSEAARARSAPPAGGGIMVFINASRRWRRCEPPPTRVRA